MLVKRRALTNLLNEFEIMKADDEFNYYLYGMDREVYKCIVLSNNLVEKSGIRIRYIRFQYVPLNVGYWSIPFTHVLVIDDSVRKVPSKSFLTRISRIELKGEH